MQPDYTVIPSCPNFLLDSGGSGIRTHCWNYSRANDITGERYHGSCAISNPKGPIWVNGEILG